LSSPQTPPKSDQYQIKLGLVDCFLCCCESGQADSSEKPYGLLTGGDVLLREQVTIFVPNNPIDAGIRFQFTADNDSGSFDESMQIAEFVS
jgi:hypothetical protein